MPPEQIVHVTLADRSYAVRIGAGLRVSVLGDTHNTPRPVVIIDETVREHWPDMGALESRAHLVSIPSGEQSKGWDVYQHVCEKILAHGIDRSTPLVAIGGGVTGDLAGFVAATLLRGIPFVQVPTTLLAMVDSSVGGKVGINSISGKNLIGAFYQPREVIIDTDFLSTLPPRIYASGLTEIVKHSVLEGEEALAFLEGNRDAIMRRQGDVLTDLIARNVAFKARIVAADEREENGLRARLNFGHTFAHALETAAGYDGRLYHGEAVAIGMMHALDVSARRGVLKDTDLLPRMDILLKSFELPTAQPTWLKLDEDAANTLMRRDKKASHGRIRYVLCRKAGDCFLED